MGLHFFMPAHLIPLVEVVRSVHTDVKLAEQRRRDHARARQAAGAGEEGRDRLPGQPHPGRADARGAVADRAGCGLAGGYRRHGAALLRLPLRRGRPDHAEGAFGLGHDLRRRQDHLARPHATPTARRRSCSATSTRAASASRPSTASSSGTRSPWQKSAPDTSALFASAWRSSARKELSRPRGRDRRGRPPPPPPPPKRRPPARRAAERAVALRARRIGPVGVRAGAVGAFALRSGRCAGDRRGCARPAGRRDSRRATTDARPGAGGRSPRERSPNGRWPPRPPCRAWPLPLPRLGP